jgi:amino acid adenylation domain-containing protein
VSDGTVEDSYPLAPLQQGMLFNGLFAAEPGLDNLQLICDAPKGLDRDALQESWRAAAVRHASLRTSFHWGPDGRQVQRVHRAAELPWHHRDLSRENAATRDHLLRAHMRDDALRGFDFERAPLARLALIRTGPSAHRLVFTFHHSILDGRSFRRLLEEVLSDTPVDAHETMSGTPTYGEYVAWLQGQDRSGAERFWRELLRGFTRPTPLLADRPAGPPPPDAGTHPEHDLTLSTELTGALRRLAREHDLTLNTLVQAAWALLLAAHGGQPDVVFGAIRSVRRGTVPGADRIVGMCLANVPVRAVVTPSAELLPWLRALRGQSVAVREHQHTPLVDIQRWSGVPAGSRLFDSIVVFENVLLDAELKRRGGAWADRSVSVRRRLGYPLALLAFAEERMLLKLLYDPRRFPPAAIARAARHLRTLLEAMAADPSRRLGDLPLADGEERHRLVFGLNATRAERPRGVCVHQLVERWAAASPDAPAVRAAGETVGYGQLNARANRLAHLLRSMGVGPEDAVGVCAERCPALVAAELAVLKAGGAYLPADPSWPVDRLAGVMRDAGARLVLCATEAAAGLSAAGVRALAFDEADRQAARLPAVDPAPLAVPANVAYLISTSGSTGRPKCVLCTHDGLVNTAAWLAGAYRLGPGERVGLLCSAAFDVSVLETWGALAAGACLHLPDEETRTTPDRLLAWLSEERVTVALVSTGMGEAVLRLRWPDGVALRTLLVMGDRLHAVARGDLPFEVVNAYGPAENAVLTTAGRVETGPGGDPLPTIGRPLPNVRTTVLDGSLRAVAGGVAGELCIGGEGLARGYLGRPDTTAARFVPDPAGSEPGARVYRSGDAVRHRPNGDLEFLGRMDRQVKVRGLRVEPGEVEAVLRLHPGVAAAVVVASGETARERRLVAYVVPQDGRPPGGAELRAFLRDRLPDFMVPSAYVPLRELPLTANGKFDRDALPEPDPDALREGPAPAPAGTPLQETLLGIWAEALGLRRAGREPAIGIHDDFFELGGHSLLAADAIMRVNEVLRTEVSVRDLFQAPTVAGLSRRIEAAGQAARDPVSAIPRLDRASHRRPR